MAAASRISWWEVWARVRCFFHEGTGTNIRSPKRCGKRGVVQHESWGEVAGIGLAAYSARRTPAAPSAWLYVRFLILTVSRTERCSRSARMYLDEPSCPIAGIGYQCAGRVPADSTLNRANPWRISSPGRRAQIFLQTEGRWA